jgi:hypothetical protein
VIPAEYSHAARSKLRDIATELERARTMDLCVQCAQARCDHPRDHAFAEPEPARDVVLIQNRLDDHLRMYATVCAPCGAPRGVHGAGVVCLCGCPPEVHGPADRRDKRWCRKCPSAKFRVEPEHGLCAGYETPDGSELCEPMRIQRRVADKQDGTKSQSTWYRDYEYPAPTVEQLAAWRGRRLDKERAERRVAAKARQEFNAAMIAGPVVERPERPRKGKSHA